MRVRQMQDPDRIIVAVNLPGPQARSTTCIIAVERGQGQFASGRDVAAIDFYQVLALYKLAIISEGIYARYLQGKTLGKDFDGMKRSTALTAQRGLDIANRSSDGRLRASSR